jgi:hypothetical protein
MNMGPATRVVMTARFFHKTLNLEADGGRLVGWDNRFMRLVTSDNIFRFLEPDLAPMLHYFPQPFPDIMYRSCDMLNVMTDILGCIPRAPTEVELGWRYAMQFMVDDPIDMSTAERCSEMSHITRFILHELEMPTLLWAFEVLLGHTM